MNRLPLALLLGLAWLAAATPAAAQPAASMRPTAADAGIAWRDLRSDQARVLAPLAGVWSTLDADQQRKWVELSTRFHGLGADEQRRVQERMREWAAMSPQDRRRARVQFQQASQLTPQERLQRWEAYQSLPPEQQRALRQQAERDNSARTARPAPAGSSDKPTVVAPPRPPATTPVAPGVVQAAPGATTKPLASGDKPPRHQQTGLPKIVATPEFVDPATLLPKRGAQAAPVREPASAPRGNAAR